MIFEKIMIHRILRGPFPSPKARIHSNEILENPLKRINNDSRSIKKVASKLLRSARTRYNHRDLRVSAISKKKPTRRGVTLGGRRVSDKKPALLRATYSRCRHAHTARRQATTTEARELITRPAKYQYRTSFNYMWS